MSLSSEIASFVQIVNRYDAILHVYVTHTMFIPLDSPSESVDGDRALPEVIKLFYT